VTRRRALLPLLAVLCAGCGSTSAHSVVAQAQKRLGSVTSADIRLRIALRTQVGGTTRTDGFALAGPFSLDARSGPAADLRYRRLSSTGGAVRVLVARTQGRIEAGTRTVPLTPAQVDELRSLVTRSGGTGVLGQVHVADWVVHPHLVRHGSLDTVTGTLDVGAIARDLVALARDGGYPAPALGGEDLKRLDSLVSSSRFLLVASHGDHVLRRLSARFQLRPQARGQRIASLFGVGGAFELVLARVDRPVHVSIR
jgi:hypothetical protein